MLELALLDVKMLRYTPSNQAAAAIYLTRKIANHINWNQEMEKITDYKEKEVRPLAKQLLTLIKSASHNAKLNAVVRKFQQKKYSYISKLELPKN